MHDLHLKALRQARLHEDPSAMEEYTVDPLHYEVRAAIKAATGICLEVQATRHCVVYYIANDAGSVAFDFDHQDFDVDGVLAALVEDFQTCPPEMLEILVEAGLHQRL